MSVLDIKKGFTAYFFKVLLYYNNKCIQERIYS